MTILEIPTGIPAYHGKQIQIKPNFTTFLLFRCVLAAFIIVFDFEETDFIFAVSFPVIVLRNLHFLREKIHQRMELV